MVTIQQVKPLEWSVRCEYEEDAEYIRSFLSMLSAIKSVSFNQVTEKPTGSLVNYPVLSDFSEEVSRDEQHDDLDPIQILKATPNYERNHVSLIFQGMGLKSDFQKFLKKVSEEAQQLEERGLLSSVIPFIK